MMTAERKQNLESLATQDLYFKKLGIDIDTVKGSKLIKNYWKFMFLMCCVGYVHIGLIRFVIHLGFGGIDATSPSLSIFNQVSLTLFKLVHFLVKGDRFMKLIWDINLLARSVNPLEQKNILAENLRLNVIIKMYLYVCWGTLISSFVFPLICIFYEYRQFGNINLQLPFGGKFPYDNGQIGFFIFNYCISVVYIYTLLHMVVGIDCLYGWYICNISAHFRILRNKLKRSAENLEIGENFNFTQAIGHIVRYHNRILEFVEELNALFGGILLCEILLSCLQMCFIIYMSSIEDNPFNMPYKIGCILVAGVQLIIYCFGGEKLKHESEMLSLDFYTDFPWHSMPVKEKKLMLFPLMRAQRLCVLSATFFEVDCTIVVYVFKTAFSFRALLSVMKE